MNLYKQMEEECRTALKQGDKVKVSVLRMLLSSIRMLQVDKGIKEPSDPEVMQIIQRSIKQHKESIEQFMAGNRTDLANKETDELRILQSYMPAQLTSDELEAIVRQIAETSNIKLKNETGKLMKLVMEKVSGRADGKVVSALVQKILT